MTEQTELLRQVHPNFIQNGEVASIAFRPNENDKGHLSVYDGDMIMPERSFKHYTETQKLKSAGVLAVTVGECASLELDAASSPLPNFDEHAHIDFSGCDKKQERSKSKRSGICRRSQLVISGRNLNRHRLPSPRSFPVACAARQASHRQLPSEGRFSRSGTILTFAPEDQEYYSTIHTRK